MFSSPAAAGTVEDEQRFLQLINQTRAGQGLSPLVAHGELTAAARSWSSTMATGDQLAHTTDMTQGITANWTVLGENVGVHGVGDVDQLFQAFVASPTHYQNLIDPRFQYVGIGVVHTSAGKLWTTHRFMAAEAPPPATSAPPTTPTTTAPPPTAPPTTSAPKTTRATSPPTTRAPKSTPPTTRATSPTNGETPPPTASPTTSAGPSDTNPTSIATTLVTGQAAPADGEPSSSELIQPDAATIEDVLIDLMAAGI